MNIDVRMIFTKFKKRENKLLPNVFQYLLKIVTNDSKSLEKVEKSGSTTNFDPVRFLTLDQQLLPPVSQSSINDCHFRKRSIDLGATVLHNAVITRATTNTDRLAPLRYAMYLHSAASDNKTLWLLTRWCIDRRR